MGLLTLMGSGLHWEGNVKDTFNPEKPKLISRNQKQNNKKPHRTHIHTQIPVIKLFKEQYSEEMILTHLSENTLNNQMMLYCRNPSRI